MRPKGPRRLTRVRPRDPSGRTAPTRDDLAPDSDATPDRASLALKAPGLQSRGSPSRSRAARGSPRSTHPAALCVTIDASARCPVMLDFLTDDVRRDPYPLYAQMRAASP